ncbi:class I glutamine amidotransferase-like protein [Neoconidiobolus thromboides FSU 785]|nr:class I glutamine amidotransferase-like protein [Neoconidiobolus thromboides FSU 785]
MSKEKVSKNIIDPYFPKLQKYKIGLVIYKEFTLLDLVGPAEVFSDNSGLFETVTIGENSNGTVGSKSNTLLFNTKLSMEEAIQQEFDILVLPGADSNGLKILDNDKFINNYKELCGKAKVVFTICTGSLLLAKTGLIDNINATTNKQAYPKYTPNYPNVKWIYHARWVHNKKYITSSGITAGTDAAMYIFSLIKGDESAKRYSDVLEYKYNDDPDNDPYAVLDLK